METSSLKKYDSCTKIKEVRFEEVTKSFGPNTVLKNISFSLEHGKIYGLIGKNGSGKTTIFSILSKLIISFQGNVLINGLNIFDPINDYKNLSFFSFSNLTFPSNMTVKEYINKCVKLRGLKISLLKKILFDDSNSYIKKNKDNFCSDLSTDSKQMLQFFIMEMLEKSNKLRFVFLDEPFKGLSIANKEKMIEKFLSLKKNGVLIFISSNNLNDLHSFADNFIFLDNGFIVWNGENNSDIIKIYDDKKLLEENRNNEIYK